MRTTIGFVGLEWQTRTDTTVLYCTAFSAGVSRERYCTEFFMYIDKKQRRPDLYRSRGIHPRISSSGDKKANKEQDNKEAPNVPGVS